VTREGILVERIRFGAGQPPPGVYRNYSQMVSGADPVSNVPWTLGNTYFNVVSHQIPLPDRMADRDTAIQAVIHELSVVGLPVMLSFPLVPGHPYHRYRRTFNLRDGMSWFVPPELGACDAELLNKTFAPSAGHAVLIVGYAISARSAIRTRSTPTSSSRTTGARRLGTRVSTS
jgi:hypothetical protein